eukprot:scaffold1638_cov258-Pinguiococcus_pyrenoidosus.AAC.30
MLPRKGTRRTGTWSQVERSPKSSGSVSGVGRSVKARTLLVVIAGAALADLVLLGSLPWILAALYVRCDSVSCPCEAPRQR